MTNNKQISLHIDPNGSLIDWGRHATVNGIRGNGGARIYRGEAAEVMKLVLKYMGKMMKEISIEEIVRLDSERTRGNWIKSETATNPRKDIFTSYPTVYSEIKEDGSETADICRMTYDTATADAAFIAAAPRIAAKCLELDRVNKELVEALEKIARGRYLTPITGDKVFYTKMDLQYIARETLKDQD